MTLNTAQYLAPLNSQQVLSGYAQGVIEGVGITIEPDGTITLNPTTAATLGFIVSTTVPATALAWPLTAGTAGAALIDDGAGNLSWSADYTPTVPVGQPFPHTGASVLPAGITAARPSGAQRGYIRYNTDYEYLEWFNGLNWLPITPASGVVSSFVSATAPTALSTGDFWYDQIVSLEKVWTGTAWVPTSPLATTTQPGRVQIGSNLQVDASSVISVAGTVGVSGGVSNTGVTAIVDNTASFSSGEALSANQGRLLQAQISAISNAANITFAGTIDGSGNLLTITAVAASNGFVVGNPLPAPALNNVDFFVICAGAGSFTPPSGSLTTVTVGDWFLSNGLVWQFLNVGYDAPTASTSQAGIVELATDVETIAGTDSTRAVTPFGLTSRVATTTTSGLVSMATPPEVVTGTNNSKAITPLGLSSRVASTTLTGLIELATPAEVIDGTDAARAVTPAGLNARVASETLTGLVELATDAEVQAGTDTARAVTPAGLNSKVASVSAPGLVELATSSETQTGTDATTAVTPLGLSSRTATETRSGIAEIATQSDTETGTDDTRIVSPLKLRTTAVYKSDFNSKGDILSATANDTPSILSVGTTGQVLVADPAAATGLSWTTFGIKNIDDISALFDGSTTVFPLTIVGVNYSPNPPTNIAVYLGGVPQIPGVGNSYTVSGSSITFTSGPPTGTTFYAFTIA